MLLHPCQEIYFIQTAGSLGGNCCDQWGLLCVLHPATCQRDAQTSTASQAPGVPVVDDSASDGTGAAACTPMPLAIGGGSEDDSGGGGGGSCSAPAGPAGSGQAAPETRLELIGDAVVTLEQGTTFTACGPTVPLAAACEPGVHAWHPEEGDLSQARSHCNPHAPGWRSFQAQGKQRDACAPRFVIARALPCPVACPDNGAGDDSNAWTAQPPGVRARWWATVHCQRYALCPARVIMPCALMLCNLRITIGAGNPGTVSSRRAD